MYIAFIAALGLLWVALSSMVIGSAEISEIASQSIPVPWLAKFVGDAGIGMLVARVYDLGLPTLSEALPKPVHEETLTLAAATVVGLLIAYTSGYALLNMPIPSNLQTPLALVILAILAYGTYDIWTCMPNQIPEPFRALISLCISIVMFFVASLVPALVLKSALIDLSSGSAAAVSAWAAGITARQIKVHFKSADLESKVAEHALPVIIQREGAVLIAVLVAYIVFKLMVVPTILFSVAVGAASSLVAYFVSATLIQESS